MSAVAVHPVTEPELDAAGEATAAAYREFYRDSSDWQWYLEQIRDLRGRAGRTAVLVVVVDGEVAGSATLELDAAVEAEGTPPAPDEAHLRMLGIDPRLRRRGAGEALLRACIDLARQRGRRRMTLHTTPLMRDAQRLYERFGFTRRPEMAAHGLTFIPFDLELAPTAADAETG